MASRFLKSGLCAHRSRARYRANPRDLSAFFDRRDLRTKRSDRKMISEIATPKRSEADRWVTLPERGTSAPLGLIGWIAERVGRAPARLLLYPITVYFLITANTARRASYEFLKRVRAGAVHWWRALHHFYYFAATILDRVYLLRGEFDRFSIT